MKTRVGRRRSSTLMVPALVLTTALGLAGCSSDDSEAEGDGGEPSSAPADTATETPSDDPSASPDTISPPDLPTGPPIRDAEGAVADIEFDASSCGLEPGEQTVSGTVTNPTDDRIGYVIKINWINETSDVRGVALAVVRGAQPGEETEWEATAELADGAVQCVPNVERGDVLRGRGRG